MIKKGKETFSGYNKPKRTPSHPTKSHAVLAKEGDTEKLIRFGQKGVSGDKTNTARAKSFKARHAGSAGTNTGGYESWHGVALPLIRRIFAEIAAKEFVSVQPMNLPSGLVFYLDFKYGTEKGPFGYNPTGKNQTGTLQGITSQSGAPTDGLYGAGRFGFSSNTKVSSADTTVPTGSVNAVDVYYDGNYTSSLS